MHHVGACIHAYTCTHPWMHVYTFLHTHVDAVASACTCTRLCTHLCTLMLILTHVYAPACTCLRASHVCGVYVHADARVHTHACKCAVTRKRAGLWSSLYIHAWVRCVRRDRSNPTALASLTCARTAMQAHVAYTYDFQLIADHRAKGGEWGVFSASGSVTTNSIS